MADDAEARLSAALHAYAELVEEPGTELPRPVPIGTAGRTAMRRWRGPALVAAAVAVVTGATWWAVGDRPGGDVVAGTSDAEQAPEAADAATSPESADPAAGSAGSYDSAAVPAGALPAHPEVGVPYLLDLYTHCGVFGADVGGTWFALDPPLVAAPAGPPAGWGNPDQPGTLVLTSRDEAVFTDEVGHELVLRAAPQSARPGPCD